MSIARLIVRASARAPQQQALVVHAARARTLRRQGYDVRYVGRASDGQALYQCWPPYKPSALTRSLMDQFAQLEAQYKK
jgi:hypothetical protein